MGVHQLRYFLSLMRTPYLSRQLVFFLSFSMLYFMMWCTHKGQEVPQLVYTFLTCNLMELLGKFQGIHGWIPSNFMNFCENSRKDMTLNLADGISWFFMVLLVTEIFGCQKTWNPCQNAIKNHEHPGKLVRINVVKFRDHSWMIMKPCQILILIQ